MLTSHATAQTIRIVGRVVGPGHEPVPGAEIELRLGDDFRASVLSDSAGNFSLTAPALAASVATLVVQALSWQTAEVSVPIDRSRSKYLVVQLEPGPLRLAGLTASYRRPKETRSVINPGSAPEGTEERLVDGVVAATSPAVQGDLHETAFAMPGVMRSREGPALLGLPASQSTATLGGMSFAGRRTPYGAQLQANVATAPYDPSRGWFSGGEIALHLVPGGMFTRKSADFVATPNEGNDLISASGAARYSLRAGWNASGPLHGKFFYSGSFDVSHQRSGLASLAEQADRLAVFGIPSDTSARLARALNQLGLAQGRTSAGSNGFTLLGGVSYRPREGLDEGVSGGITTYLDVQRSFGNLPVGALTLGSTGTATHTTAMVMGHLYHYLLGSVLNETRLAVSATKESADAARAPTGFVQVANAGADGGLVNLAFGGADNAITHSSGVTLEGSSRLTWYDMRRRHRFQLHAVGRHETDARSHAADAGSYSYASLADLEENRPSLLTRVINAAKESGAQSSYALSMADSWRVNDALSLMLGARLDATRAGDFPRNDMVAARFDARTDRALMLLQFSPRLGFTWQSAASKRAETFYQTGPLGAYLQKPAGVLRGGVGVFRNSARLRLINQVRAQGGSVSGPHIIRCEAPAQPPAGWSDWDAADDTAGRCTVSTEAVPDVALLAASYQPEYSLRASLGWEGRHRSVAYGVSAIHSENRAQRSTQDRNLRAAPVWALGDEASRPVFVAANSIVPSNGHTTITGSRQFAEFGHVLEYGAEGRSRSTQLMLTLTPDVQVAGKVVFLRATYVLANVRERSRGFDGGGGADPRAFEWASGALDVRHSLRLDAGWSTRRYTVSAFSAIESGRPFTPIIGGDINGDGYADRAFIFEPGRVSDAALRNGLESIARTAPSRVSDCLAKQVHRIAERNSCRGPWTVAANARLEVRLGNELPQRTALSLTLSEIAAGLDGLLHRESQGWGSTAYVDAVLYSVRGFDADAARFQYLANPRFGRVLPMPGTERQGFRLTFAANFKLGAGAPSQQIGRVVRARRAGSLNVDSLKSFYLILVPDPYLDLVMDSDSFRLDSAQLRSVVTARHVYLDSLALLADNLTRRLDAARADVPRQALLQLQTEFTNAAYALLWQQRTVISTVLSPFQIGLMPEWLRAVLARATPPKEGELQVW